ncbi:mycothiol synthase [Georgenia subflava]|uniref:Mycothiol acetyltransferase n=1 Tax=Georgenia subflava TaxID=1622177 RepID=A0A6N7EJJ0_9MICO|nr:mycothiol synthase [Georgenia subflava]MPV37213.1 mycothiol synthase [Georgenia subflava]
MIETDALDQAAATAVLGLAGAVAAADGVEALSEQTLLEVRTPLRQVHHLLVPGEDGLAGYAQVDAGPEGGASAELAVHPDHRRRGVGRALVDAVRERVPGVAVWAHGNLPGARALAAATGMEVVRELLQMAAPLDRQEPAAPRSDVDVTTFEVGADEEAWVGLNARAFADHPEQGRMTVADLRAREAEDWFDPTLLWLARPAGAPQAQPLASMWVKVVPGEHDGEIYAVGVDPEAQGRGLGGALTDLALAEMAARGLRRATLYVEGDNTAALRTYARAGFETVATDVQYR